MKKFFFFTMLMALLISCKTTNQPTDQMVDVTVSFSGMDIQVTPEYAPSRMPAESDNDADQARVKRIALSVYNTLDDKLVKTVVQNANVDPDDFGIIEMRIPVGSYKFVAVADTSKSTDTIAVVNSISSVSFGSVIISNPTYTTVQEVIVEGNTTQNVIVEMGTRKNATFTVKITDKTPDEVDTFEVKVAPESDVYTNLLVDPATGYASQQWQYKKAVKISDVGTITKKNFNIPLMLTASSQSVNVMLNAFDVNGDTLYTRTITDVPLQQGHRTVATGTFFSPEITTSFTFDVVEINDTISLD